MINLQKTVHLDLEVTAHEVAYLFSEMDGDEQAVFFNELYRLTQQWKNPVEFQFQEVTDSKQLNSGGREIMRKIGIYADI